MCSRSVFPVSMRRARAPGAANNIIDGRGFTLGNHFRFAQGDHITLTSYLIYPPHDGPMVVRLVAEGRLAFETSSRRRITAMPKATSPVRAR